MGLSLFTGFRPARDFPFNSCSDERGSVFALGQDGGDLVSHSLGKLEQKAFGPELGATHIVYPLLTTPAPYRISVIEATEMDMTHITAHEDFTLAGAKQIEADLAAARRDAGLPPLSVEEAEADKEAAFAAMDADRNPRTIYLAEIAHRALLRAWDDHERATRTGLYAPVDMNPLWEG